MRHSSLIVFSVLAGAGLASGCSIITSLDGWSFDQTSDGGGQLDAGVDRGDAAVVDGGPDSDAGPDGPDAGGPCSETCSGATPFCDPVLMRCTACLTAEHCSAVPTTTCADPRHLRTYDAACVAGECEYAPTDSRCPGGCDAGACRVDVWVPLPVSPLSEGSGTMSVVWSGTEMIVWGRGGEGGVGAR